MFSIKHIFSLGEVSVSLHPSFTAAISPLEMLVSISFFFFAGNSQEEEERWQKEDGATWRKKKGNPPKKVSLFFCASLCFFVPCLSCFLLLLLLPFFATPTFPNRNSILLGGRFRNSPGGGRESRENEFGGWRMEDGEVEKVGWVWAENCTQKTNSEHRNRRGKCQK